jgi:amino acid adenylation domain-containing protein
VAFPRADLRRAIPARFEDQVRRHADRVAIQTRRHTVTYDQLNRWVDRVAQAIRGRPETGGATVALLLAHDVPLLAAMLATLKAGQIYVPLDPSYPRARLAYMLRDSRACLLVTDAANRSLADTLAGKQVPLLSLEELDGSGPAASPDPASTPESPAFLLYTSGSTGEPKGFVQTHRNVLHDVMHYTNAGHFCAEDRFALISSCSFADSVRTIYSALLNGAALYPFDVRKEGLAPLARWLIEHQITIYRSVPTVFRHFCQTLTAEHAFTHLRLIYLAGEPVYRRDVELFRRHFSPTCVLVNRLGTGEALTFRCNFIDRHTPIAGTHVPVGYAVPDKEVLLLDESGRTIEGPGVGEIVVKSRYLSPGYWGRSGLTSATFLADPAGTDARLYRTGDLGRLLPDGSLLHLGRKDFQLKIRGHRVEVAEIEAALLEHPAIKDAVVVAREDTQGDVRLVAYLTPASPAAPRATALRRALGQRLPDYMIPAAFVVLDAFPYTTSGKVDRRSLPAPDHSRPDLESAYTAPRTAIELRLAQIWAQVLGFEEVGIHDDFHELGGNSLLATQIVSRAIRTFQTDLTVQTLLDARTVAEMAMALTRPSPEK